MMPRLIVLAVATSLLSCAPTGRSANQTREVVGTIYVTGNEPFTRLALQAEDGNRYILKCEKDLEETLGRSQGKKYALQFSVLEVLPEGMVITVISAKPADK